MASILFALNHNFLDTGLTLLYQEYVHNCLINAFGFRSCALDNRWLRVQTTSANMVVCSSAPSVMAFSQNQRLCRACTPTVKTVFGNMCAVGHTMRSGSFHVQYVSSWWVFLPPVQKRTVTIFILLQFSILLPHSNSSLGESVSIEMANPQSCVLVSLETVQRI